MLRWAVVAAGHLAAADPQHRPRRGARARARAGPRCHRAADVRRAGRRRARRRDAVARLRILVPGPRTPGGWMTSTWYVAFALLTLLSVANAVVLVAALRQIGVLHQRVKPMGPGQQEGPQPGSELPFVSFEPVGRQTSSRRPGDAPVTVIAYVNPGCGLCDTLTQA